MRAFFLVFCAVALSACPATTQQTRVADVMCSEDSDCKGFDARYCRHGQCVTCVGDSDCGGGACDQGRCLAASECPCSEGETCVDDRCVPGAKDVAVAEVASEETLCFGEPCDGEDRAAVQISQGCLPLAGSDDVVALAPVAFAFDDHTLSVDAQDVLLANADCLEQAPDLTIVIEGHADERGTNEYNLALANERAMSVRQYLTRLGVEEHRLQVVSKGEEQPMCFESSEECWQQNRRVDLVQVRASTLSANP